MKLRNLVLAATLALSSGMAHANKTEASKVFEESIQQVDELIAFMERSLFLKDVIGCSVWSSPSPKGMFESGSYKNDAIGLLAFEELKQLNGIGSLRSIVVHSKVVEYNKEDCQGKLNTYYAASYKNVDKLAKMLEEENK